MNRARILLLTAYLVFVIVGGVIYVQSVSNMVLYTEADQEFPSGIHVQEVRIPHYAGAQDYSISCNFSFENPSNVPILLRAFSFEIAIDNGESGNPYDEVRLASEKIGEAGESLGIGGPVINPGTTLVRPYALKVLAVDSFLINHVNADGKYTVILYGTAVSYGFPGTSLLRQFWPYYMTEEVSPIG